MNNFLKLIILVFSNFYFSQNYAVSSIPEELKSKANIVIRNDVSTYVINSIDDMEINHQNVFTVLNKAGDEDATVAIHYNKSTRVSDIKVQILDANGKVINKYSKSDFTDVSSVSAGSLYQDDRVLFLNYIPVSYPYTISYSYNVKTPNTIFLPDFYPLLDYNTSLENTKITIVNKSGIKLRTKIVESSFAKVTSSGDANNMTYSYQNFPAIEKETYSPSLKTILPRVQFSLEKFTLEGKQGDMTNWTTFGNWMYKDLLTPVSVVTPEIKAEVAALNLTGTTSEKVKKIYQYMQNKTRYVNVSIGIGGWQPIIPDEVRKKGYGDCKALTNYMKTLLDAAGIKSYYSVITSDETPQSFDPDFPKMGGNHVILMIPTEKEPIWLENTSQLMAFNHLSYNTTDRNVLAVKENGIEIIDTPVYQPEENQEIIKTKVVLNEDNSINLNSDFYYSKAQYDFNMYMLGLSKEDVKDAVKGRYDHIKIENLEVNNINNDKEKAEITYQAKFKVNDYSKKLGNDIFFRVLPLLETSNISADEERKLPLSLPFSYQDIYETEFTIPAGYKLAEKPLPIALNSEFGSYNLDFKLDGNKLLVNRKITISKGNYPKEKFKAYADFRKKTTSLDHTKILISKQ
ncbi:hypothetical protein GCM10010992_22040 [Cloacibacterium rupense]|uniref:DUF3857 domain-containing protein n=1 Tax=Cloacibacterium rupense TaxID=517423 RepID=A0ABQ2NKC6_9FLAO|nr:DUF3857 domain-containing protein [Cloacibacterium rupense]GGP05542.1 hypothetical protein GCM10010992_22040 [Cloacibacterium rupense]